MSSSADRLTLFVGVLLAVLLLASLSGSARAQAPDRRAAYLGAGAAFGFEDFDGVPGGVDIDEAYGFDAWAGYRFADLLAAEVQLEYLDGFDFDYLGFDVSGQAVASTVNLKLFPLASMGTDRIEPFVFAGIGLAWAEFDTGFGDVDETAFAARFGGGIDLYVTESLALQASSSYVQPADDLEDFSYVSLVIGLQYRFGRSPGH